MSEKEVTNDAEEQVTSGAGLELWDPKKAVLWSLLFSPIFGAFLHSKNWQTLGKPEEAKKSMYWVYGTIAVLLVNLLFPFPTILMPVALIAWFFLSAKKQMAEVPEDYCSKPWKKPLKFGAIGLVCVLILNSCSGGGGGYKMSDFEELACAKVNEELSSNGEVCQYVVLSDEDVSGGLDMIKDLGLVPEETTLFQATAILSDGEEIGLKVIALNSEVAAIQLDERTVVVDLEKYKKYKKFPIWTDEVNEKFSKVSVSGKTDFETSEEYESRLRKEYAKQGFKPGGLYLIPWGYTIRMSKYYADDQQLRIWVDMLLLGYGQLTPKSGEIAFVMLGDVCMSSYKGGGFDFEGVSVEEGKVLIEEIEKIKGMGCPIVREVVSAGGGQLRFKTVACVLEEDTSKRRKLWEKSPKNPLMGKTCANDGKPAYFSMGHTEFYCQKCYEEYKAKTLQH